MISPTTGLKDELARIQSVARRAMAAEVTTILRFAGGLHLVSGRISIEVGLGFPVTVRWLRVFLQLLHNVESAAVAVSGGSLGRGRYYIVHVVHKIDELVWTIGLADPLRRPVYGLPASLVASGREDSVMTWRGAPLARDSLMEPRRSTPLEVTCLGPEATLAVIGCVRKLGATARPKEVRGTDRAFVCDSEVIGQLAEAMGAKETFKTWQDHRERHGARGSTNRPVDFGDANPRRSVRVAVAAGVRVERAFEIFGNEAPAHLLETGKLRLWYKQTSFEELGKHTDLPLAKGAVADRTRRLLAVVDGAAHGRGIPDTEAVFTLGMPEED